MTQAATPFFPISSGSDTGPLLSFRNIILFLDTKTILKQCYTISREWNQALEDSNLWQLLLERELKLQFLPPMTTPNNNNNNIDFSNSPTTANGAASSPSSMKKYEWKQLYFLLTRYSRWRWRRGIERNYDVEFDMNQQLKSLLEEEQEQKKDEGEENTTTASLNNGSEDKVEDSSNIPLYNNPCYFSPLIHNYQFKVMILGDKKVGKSSVMFRLLTRQSPKKEYIKKLISTDGMSQFSSLIQHTYEPNHSIQLQIYDSNIVDIGTYVKVCRMYGTFTHCVIIVFNARSKRSYFNSINKWLPMIRKRNPNLPIFLVANKCDNFQKYHASTRFPSTVNANTSADSGSSAADQSSKRDVSREEAMEMAKEKNIIYREVSAATGEGIDELCTDLINTIFAKVVQVTPKDILDEAHETCEALSQDYNVAFKQRIIEVPKFVPTIQDRDYFETFTESEISNASEHDEYEEEEAGAAIGEGDELDHHHYDLHQHYEEVLGSGGNNNGATGNGDDIGGDESSTSSSISESEDEEKMKQIVEKSFAEADQETPYFRINVSQSQEKRQSKYYANSKALTDGLTEDNLKEISHLIANNNVSIEGSTKLENSATTDNSKSPLQQQEGNNGGEVGDKKCFIQ